MRTTSFRLLLAVMSGVLLLVTSCKKDKDQPKPATQDELVYRDGVVSVDSNLYKVSVDTTLLLAGIYQFTAVGAEPLNIQPGTVFFGNQYGGFLRRAVTVTTQGTTLTVTTEMASLANVFKSGRVQLRIPVSSLHERGAGASSPSLHSEFPIGSQVIAGGASRLEIEGGNVSIDADFVCDITFAEAGIQHLKIGTFDSKLTSDLTFKVKLANSSHFHRSALLATRSIDVLIGGVPAVIDLDLAIPVDFESNASCEARCKATADGSFSAGIEYNGQWVRTLNGTATPKLEVLDFGPVQVNGSASLALSPKISFSPGGALLRKLLRRFWENTEIAASAEFPIVNRYQIAGKLNTTYSRPLVDWNISAGLYFEPAIALKARLFDINLVDKYENTSFTLLEKRTPDKLIHVRTIEEDQALPDQPTPVKIRVVDSEGHPQAGVPVSFAKSMNLIAQTSSAVTPDVVLSDEDGYAEAVWQRGQYGSGALDLEATFEAKAQKANGQLLKKSPIRFPMGCDSLKLKIIDLYSIPSSPFNSSCSGIPCLVVGPCSFFGHVYFTGGVPPFTVTVASSSATISGVDCTDTDCMCPSATSNLPRITDNMGEASWTGSANVTVNGQLPYISTTVTITDAAGATVTKSQ